jgi:hypothetical protein
VIQIERYVDEPTGSFEPDATAARAGAAPARRALKSSQAHSSCRLAADVERSLMLLRSRTAESVLVTPP